MTERENSSLVRKGKVGEKSKNEKRKKKKKKKKKKTMICIYYIHRLTLEAPGSGPRPYAKLKNRKGRPPTERALTLKLMSANYLT